MTDYGKMLVYDLGRQSGVVFAYNNLYESMPIIEATA
jgi:hypothetical protein